MKNNLKKEKTKESLYEMHFYRMGGATDAGVVSSNKHFQR
jgi:hypothetical protein